MSRRPPALPSPELLSRRPWGSSALGAAVRCDPLVVALSGGADSTALLCALVRLRAWLWRGRGAPFLAAAHFNHCIRGAESDADEAAARALCDRLGVPLHIGRADVPKEAAGTGESLEMAARRLRRGFLSDVAARTGAAAIATGHTADDQAELFFLRLKRGSSLRGLSAMRFVTPGADGGADADFLKPLLRLRHGDLVSWLQSEGIPWREDSSNSDPDAADRNRIRHVLVPAAIEALGPAFHETLGRTLDLLRDDADLLDFLAASSPMPTGATGAVDAVGATCPAGASCRAIPLPLARRAAAAALYASPGVDPEKVTLQAVEEKAAAVRAAALPPQPRIGIFGGSFDPVHRGHIALARAALDEAGLDMILFVPAATSPFKTLRRTAPAADRIEMLRRAIAGEPRFAIDDTDIRRGGVSYTFDLVKALRRAGPPDARWFFLLGADSLVSLHSWHRADELVRLCRFVAFGRPGTEVDSAALGFAPEISARLARDFHPSLRQPVSSTEARILLAAGRGDEAPVPPEVAEYAISRHLYSTDSAAPDAAGKAPAT